MENLDPEEIEKFNEMASTWWDPNGDFKALHDINPSRLDYILSRVRTVSYTHLTLPTNREV